ncbi:ATP-binding protein, partial [Salmonella enterica subsp. enterica serovar Senftenberg]|nr:ATP-binding protein [Salmonella enterica subsp. enterica serovar Senftenberg]
DVVKHLGSNQKSSSVTRSQLISKGLIYSPEHGRVAFTVPGMTDFLHRQDPTILRSR